MLLYLLYVGFDLLLIRARGKLLSRTWKRLLGGTRKNLVASARTKLLSRAWRRQLNRARKTLVAMDRKELLSRPMKKVMFLIVLF